MEYIQLERFEKFYFEHNEKSLRVAFVDSFDKSKVLVSQQNRSFNSDSGFEFANCVDWGFYGGCHLKRNGGNCWKKRNVNTKIMVLCFLFEK